MKITLYAIILLCLAAFTTVAQTKKVSAKTKTVVSKKQKTPLYTPPLNPLNTRIKITTDSGVIVLKLYDKTPKHRDNFIKLVTQKYFDNLLFHRIIKGFMIQGGDPDSRHSLPGQNLGNGGPGYTIPAEFDTTLFHKRGVLAAARESDSTNPTKASSGSQFYIVQGKIFNDDQMNAFEQKYHITLPDQHREVYKTLGGAPSLDSRYTVFGEVESGIEVVDKIAGSVKDTLDRPLNDIRMKMEILK